MAETANKGIVFLPVKPEYAEKIMSGEKNIEFRKTVWKESVGYIVVYASSPVKKVLGFAKVDSLVIDSPGNLWKNYNATGGINKKKFMEYFHGRKNAYGILLGDVIQLKEPYAPKEIGIEGVIPQNFKYLNEEVFRKVEKLSAVEFD